MTLKELRLSAGKSRKETAQHLNVTLTAVSNYESGIRKINIEQALKLAELFDVSVEEVIRAQITCRTSRE